MHFSIVRRLVVAFAFFLIAGAVMATGPVLQLPGTITAEAADASGAVVFYRVTSDGVVIGDDEDGRGATAVCSPGSSSTFPVGGTLVTCTAQNDGGETSTGTFLVNVVDTTAPSLSLPQVVLVTTTGSSEVVTWNASASDRVDGNVAVDCTPPSGSTFAVGVTIVSCSATDAHGNTNSDTFDVSVAGSTPPVLILPNQTAEATSAAGANVSFDFIDNLDFNITCTPLSGSLFALGTTTVDCVTDSLTGSFSVNVVDTTPPVLTVPGAMTVEATSPAVVTFSTSATDLVDGSVGVACTPPSGSTFPFGSTAVTCSASDSRGNTSSDVFVVTVVDTTPPTITSVTASPATLWPPNKQMVPVTITANVFDAGDSSPLVQIYDVLANEPITAADWQITGPLTLNLRADRLGNGNGRTYTIFIEAIDDSGNRSTATVTVKVPHDQSGKSRI